MKWNKLITRPLDEEEKEYYKDSKIDFMWEGDDQVNEMYKKHGVMCYKPNITKGV